MHCDWLQKATGHEAMCQGLRETACKYRSINPCGNTIIDTHVGPRAEYERLKLLCKHLCLQCVHHCWLSRVNLFIKVSLLTHGPF